MRVQAKGRKKGQAGECCVVAYITPPPYDRRAADGGTYVMSLRGCTALVGSSSTSAESLRARALISDPVRLPLALASSDHESRKVEIAIRCAGACRGSYTGPGVWGHWHWAWRRGRELYSAGTQYRVPTCGPGGWDLRSPFRDVGGVHCIAWWLGLVLPHHPRIAFAEDCQVRWHREFSTHLTLATVTDMRPRWPPVHQ